MLNSEQKQLASELVETILFFNQKNWSPATSTNYSVRLPNSSDILISRSGVDKSKFLLEDLIQINLKGEIAPHSAGFGIKSSAETEIHTFIYEKFPEVNCVLHTHSLIATMLSREMLSQEEIIFEGYELQKGLEGNQTHQLSTHLPIVPNSQSMSEILANLQPWWNKPFSIHGFLIAGHGLYSWGKSLSAAKRHIETLEFLLECEFQSRKK